MRLSWSNISQFRAFPAVPALSASLLALLVSACSQNPQQVSVAEAEPVAVAVPVVEQEIPPRPISTETLYDLLVAEMAGHRRDYDLALGNYIHQARETRDVQVVARATRLAQYLGSYEEAREMAQLWLELAPDSMEAHFVYAMMLVKQGDVRMAFYHMHLVRELGGEAAFTTIAAESLKLTDADRQDLLGIMDEALLNDPNDVELLMAKSIVLQQDNPNEALATINKARLAAPADPQPVIIEATLLQQLKRTDEALTLLRDTLDKYPYHQRLRLQYARILTREDLAASREQFEILLAGSPGDPDLIFSLGLINKELDDPEQAASYFRELLELGARESEAHYYLGLLAVQDGDEISAIGHFKLVEPGQDFLPAMTRLARMLLQSDDLTDMRQFFSDQRRRYPEAATQLYILESDILVRLEEYQAADLLLTEALARETDNTSLLYARSLVAEKQKDLARAEADLRKIIDADPNNYSALNALGYTLTNYTDRHEEALALITRALALKPKDATIMDSMGWVHFRLGNFDEAAKYLQQAYARAPDAEIAAHLGEVLWTMGKTDEAMALWQESLASEPRHPVLLETIERLGVAEELKAAQ